MPDVGDAVRRLDDVRARGDVDAPGRQSPTRSTADPADSVECPQPTSSATAPEGSHTAPPAPGPQDRPAAHHSGSTPAPTPPPARRRLVPKAVLVGTAFVLGWGLFGGLGSAIGTTVYETYDAPQRLEIEGSSVDVDVRAGDSAQVAVEERGPWGASCAPGQGRESGGTLSLPAGCLGGLPWGGRDSTITVPAGIPAQITTRSGDVRVEDTASAVTIRSGSGDVDLDDVAGADVEVSSGSVRLGDVRGDVAIRASSGSVRLGDVRGDVAIRASSGNVRGDVAAPQRLDARTESGSIDLDLANAPATVHLESLSGDVELTLPRGAPYRVHTTTGSGDITSEVPNDATAPRSLTVTTVSGDIRIRQ